MTGFGVNGTTSLSILVQCGSDQMFEPHVQCLSKYNNKYCQESLTFTCMTGFGVNGTTSSSTSVQCGSDQMFEPHVQCLSKYTAVSISKKL